MPKTNLQVSSFLKENMSLLMDGESDWLNLVWENCFSGTLCNWSTFHAKQSPSSPSSKSKTSLLPLFQECSTEPSMVYHAMILIKRSTEVLNPTQIPVMTCDQPIYAIAKQSQWNGLDPTICEGRFFVMLGGFHIKKSSLKLIGDVLRDSEWSRLLAQAGIFTPGVFDKLTFISYTKRTRRSHQITLAALHILKTKAFESREDKTVDFETWVNRMLQSSGVSNVFYRNLVQELEANVLIFIKSIRIRNWKMYVKSLKAFCPCFFALNHHLYARWASVHIRDIEVLQESSSDLIEEFDRGNFVVTKSRNRFSAIAVDQNHEQCNATLKGRGGTIGMFQKDEALRRW